MSGSNVRRIQEIFQKQIFQNKINQLKKVKYNSKKFA